MGLEEPWFCMCVCRIVCGMHFPVMCVCFMCLETQVRNAKYISGELNAASCPGVCRAAVLVHPNVLKRGILS